MANTRFNPTTNGYLHLGHLYMALVNQAEAHASGGVFGVRFDDDQVYWNWKYGDRVREFKEQMIVDLATFGINPAYWHSQMEMEQEAKDLLHNQFRAHVTAQAFAPNRGAAEVRGMTCYPYVEEITAHKVIFDFIDGCTWIIRGMDLLTEDCLYRHLCERFTIPIPRLTYIPRLLFAGDEVSKTAGNFKLKDYHHRAGEVLERLAEDCLIDPAQGWRVENVKDKPILGGWAYGN